MEDLANKRKELDKIDRELVGLLKMRDDKVLEISEIKNRINLPPLDEKRWAKVISTRTSWGNEIGLNTKFIKDIFNRIHIHSLRIQEDGK